MNTLEHRIIELSYRHKLSHISSCLNTVNLLAKIYEQRKEDEPVILGNGHAGLALYVVLESKGLCDAEEMIHKHGVHPSRDIEHGIWCSSGSLGQAETVAVGMALADLTRTVWLVTSDGACAEGSAHEAMRVARQHCPNLKAYCVYNGLGAYGKADLSQIPSGMKLHIVDAGRYPQWLRGLPGHYLTLTDAQRQELLAA